MILDPDSLEKLDQLTNSTFIIDDSLFASFVISLIFLNTSTTIIPTPNGMVTPKDKKIIPIIK